MRNDSSGNPKEVAGCPDCGSLVNITVPGSRLCCPRCGATLHEIKKDSINRTLAFSLSGLLLFIPASFLPILQLNIMGLTGDCSLARGVSQLFINGFWGLSFLVLFCSILMPAAVFLLLSGIAASVKLDYYPPFLRVALKAYQALKEWAMLDVYMLGVLIAFIKMDDLGEISTDIGLYCFFGILLFAIISTLAFDPRLVWNKIESTIVKESIEAFQINRTVLCRSCQRVCHFEKNESPANRRCPRCNSRLYFRKPNTLSRTCALVVTGFLLLIPANLCPITYIVYHGAGKPDTIISGIAGLIRDGLIPIAILVFFASVIVPIFKLTGLSFMLSAVHFKWRLNTYQCTIMYRLIAVIGRWSMLDLFMLTILAALIDMGAISSIVPGVGATAFASVVVVSMFAAINFDPRILWDMEGMNQ